MIRLTEQLQIHFKPALKNYTGLCQNMNNQIQLTHLSKYEEQVPEVYLRGFPKWSTFGPEEKNYPDRNCFQFR